MFRRLGTSQNIVFDRWFVIRGILDYPAQQLLPGITVHFTVAPASFNITLMKKETQRAHPRSQYCEK